MPPSRPLTGPTAPGPRRLPRSGAVHARPGRGQHRRATPAGCRSPTRPGPRASRRGRRTGPGPSPAPGPSATWAATRRTVRLP